MQAPANAEARLTILPNLFPMDADMTARPAYADDGASDRRGEDRSEVYQLREYRPGDDIRQIHWKLSSKLDELILKEASQPESRSLLVFWDKRTGTPQQMDALAEVVSSTGAALLQGGVQYTLSWTEGDDLQAQDILDENQLLQAIPELVKTRGSADCRLPEMGDYSRILYFGVKPEERMMTSGCILSSARRSRSPMPPPLPLRIIRRRCSDWRFSRSCKKVKTDSNALSPGRRKKECISLGTPERSAPY